MCVTLIAGACAVIFSVAIPSNGTLNQNPAAPESAASSGNGKDADITSPQILKTALRAG